MSVPTSNPTTYTVPESKVWLSPDGKDSFWFREGDIISMALAIRMGMPGAAYETTSPFSALEQSAIADLIAESSPPVQLSTTWARTYDNRTAAAGDDASLVISPGTLYGGLIRVAEPGKRLARLGIKVTTFAAASTVSMAVYGIYEGGDSQHGLAGSLVHAVTGTLNTSTNGYKSINTFSQNIALPPDYYWIMITPSAEMTIKGFQSTDGQIGRGTGVDEVYSGCSRVQALPFPQSLPDAIKSVIAPLIYFELDQL